MKGYENNAVIHRTYGRGIVTSISDKYIWVRFTEKETKFAFPGVFEKYLTFEEKELQEQIEKELLKKTDITILEGQQAISNQRTCQNTDNKKVPGKNRRNTINVSLQNSLGFIYEKENKGSIISNSTISISTRYSCLCFRGIYTRNLTPNIGSSFTDSQYNSIAMLHYLAALAQSINKSDNSRLYLEEAYSSLINNNAPKAVDNTTESYLCDLLDILEKYCMIGVKRERLQYIYE